MHRRFVLCVTLVCPLLSAQFCRFSVAGINRSRRVMGPISAECPGLVVHTAPFGNWGVTSNFGTKQNSHQFQGWCHDSVTCDSLGRCITNCRDGWYEWNSCTQFEQFRAPNCALYNAKDCTEQETSMGINVHGTRVMDVAVKCPVDANGDGITPEAGGCSDLSTLSPGANFMSLYELDPGGPDDLVQTLYFPDTPVPLRCDVWGCAPGSSNWVTPSFFDGPSAPQKVSAEMAAVVNWGVFMDPGGGCRASISTVTSVSGASFAGPAVAPESITAAFGEGLAPVAATAGAVPLPTSLESASVRVTDRTGARRSAPIFFVSPRQINFLVPAGTAPGTATVQVYRGDYLRASGTVQVEAVAPALFTASADGRGVASAMVVRTRADGSQVFQPAFDCGVGGSCVAAPIQLEAVGERLSLVLFGTGIRGRTTISVKIGEEPAPVLYSGPQGQFIGLDQINVALSPSLRGQGEVGVVVVVDGWNSNVVTIAAP